MISLTSMGVEPVCCVIIVAGGAWTKVTEAAGEAVARAEAAETRARAEATEAAAKAAALAKAGEARAKAAEAAAETRAEAAELAAEAAALAEAGEARAKARAETGEAAARARAEATEAAADELQKVYRRARSRSGNAATRPTLQKESRHAASACLPAPMEFSASQRVL